MPAQQTLSNAVFLVDDIKLAKQEYMILEAELFIRLYEELKEIIKNENKDYFRLLKINYEKEKSMIETNFIRCIINDILSTEEYTLSGIAYYTDTPEEIIIDVASGRNTSPTFSLSQKVMALHRSVRSELYNNIFGKIRSYDSSENNVQMVV